MRTTINLDEELIESGGQKRRREILEFLSMLPAVIAATACGNCLRSSQSEGLVECGDVEALGGVEE